MGHLEKERFKTKASIVYADEGGVRGATAF